MCVCTNIWESNRCANLRQTSRRIMCNPSIKPYENAQERERTALEKLSDRVDAALSSSFGFLGHLLGIRPSTFMIVSFIITFACCYGFSKFESESRSEKLWIPQGTQAQADQVSPTKGRCASATYTLAKHACTRSSLVVNLSLIDEQVCRLQDCALSSTPFHFRYAHITDQISKPPPPKGILQQRLQQAFSH